MQPWFGFYAVIGAAAATLLGLLFVAVSMNAAAMLGVGHETAKRLAEQAFQNYQAVLLISLLALFPDMNTSTFGLVTICVTTVWAMWMLVRFYLALVRPSDHESRWYALRRHLSSLIGFGMLIIAALRMAMKWGEDRNLFAIATIVLLFSATLVSWDLLIRIAKTHRSH